MKERPILFNGDMVKAILDGRKTQTRRPIKDLPECTIIDAKRAEIDRDPHMAEWLLKTLKCPFGQPGDRLWVRETWAHHEGAVGGIIFKARCPENLAKAKKWHPSIHMPRWASRITLEIAEIRVERVQDITEEDAMAEGFEAGCDSYGDGKFEDVLEHEWTARDEFCNTWDSIYAKQGAGWDLNLPVWVIKFHRVEVQE
jgi:hypothetical protein